MVDIVDLFVLFHYGHVKNVEAFPPGRLILLAVPLAAFPPGRFIPSAVPLAAFWPGRFIP